MKNKIIKVVESVLPADLVRNIHGGIDAKIMHNVHGEIPTTLEGALLERAESGEFGEVAPLPESQVKRKLINEKQLIIDENLAYLVSTDYYKGRNDERVELGLEPIANIVEKLEARQVSRDLVHAARDQIKLLTGETE